MTGELHSWFEKLLICRRKAAARKITGVVDKVGQIKRQEKIEAERRRLEELRRKAEETARIRASISHSTRSNDGGLRASGGFGVRIY